MHKRTYLFKYTISSDTSDTVHIRKIRAVTKQEANSRFRHWIKYRDDAKVNYIVNFWLVDNELGIDES